MAQSLEFKIPEGYIFDKENSTDEVIRFKPIEKKILYSDVCRELFLDKPSWRLPDSGVPVQSTCTLSANIHHSTISTSYKQIQQLLALNKLMNVAKYLNGNWEPNFITKGEYNWYIDYDYEDLILDTDWTHIYRHSHVYFKSEELALQAIEILGEKEVKKALGIFE